MNMAQKLLAVIMVLLERGWKVHAQLDLQGWGIYVDYIDEGPQFGLLIRLDPIAWSPYITYQDIAQLIVDEVQDALNANYRNFKPSTEEA